MQESNFTKIYLKLERWLSFKLLTISCGVILPLVIFSVLAFIVSREPNILLTWDSSILLAIHQTTQPLLDTIAVTTTTLGGFYGVWLISLPIVILLAYQRKWSAFIYLIVTIFSSDMLNQFAKSFFHRVRPDLWELSRLQLTSFSFPSGHAMGSMTLVVAILLITRGTKFHYLYKIIGSLYVLLIAWTRLYLGYHYPSDILGGWMLAIAWVITLDLLFGECRI